MLPMLTMFSQCTQWVFGPLSPVPAVVVDLDLAPAVSPAVTDIIGTLDGAVPPAIILVVPLVISRAAGPGATLATVPAGDLATSPTAIVDLVIALPVAPAVIDVIGTLDGVVPPAIILVAPLVIDRALGPAIMVARTVFLVMSLGNGLVLILANIALIAALITTIFGNSKVILSFSPKLPLSPPVFILREEYFK